jgi:high-affinity Fe2+/Pb2+ permease
MPVDERYPVPFLKMSPSGLPGLFVVLFVAFGFSTLFVSREVAQVLLWLMVAIVLVVVGLIGYQWLSARRRKA